VSEINQNGRITTTLYDEQGRTKSIETPEGKISYSYDKYGRQVSVQTDNDPPTYYTYDRYGRLATVSSDNKTTYYEYDAFGNLAKTSLPNGIVTTYVYDVMNRLTKLTNFKDANKNSIFDSGDDRVSQFDYRLDLLGRKEYATEWFGNGDSQKNKIDWTYDNAGRLIREVFDHYDNSLDQTQEWEYDLVGNRLRQTLNRGNDVSVEEVTTYRYDVNDRLLEEIFDDLTDANKDRVTIYDYDHTQQTYKYVSENGVKLNETTFAYDAQGRMSVVKITTFGEDGAPTRIERTSYEYGSDGIRVSALHEIDADADGVPDTSKLTTYLNDPLNITGYSQVLKQIETDNKTGEETHIIYIIGHQRISQIVTDKYSNQQEYYFTFDGHGSTRVLTDLARAIVQLYSFDAYGNTIGFNPSEALTEFLYSGEQFDSKIGQQYLRARYYDPATGRFNRLDPFFGNAIDPQSFHKYLYTHADPVNGIDPSGLMTLGSMMASISNMMNMTVRVMNVAQKVYSGINTLSTVLELYQIILSGDLVKIITRQIAPQLTQWSQTAGAPVTAKLTTAVFWEDAASVLAVNIETLLKAVQKQSQSLIRLMGNPNARWLLYMPTPWESVIPNPSPPRITLPAYKIAQKPVDIQFGGGGGDNRGRLFGFGTVVDKKTTTTPRQIFRMDYHTLTSTQLPGLHHQTEGTGRNGNVFHFHIY
jgi:RHS repeat-associated protein